MLVKKTYKNQITLPKALSDRFPGVDYFEANENETGYIVLKPVKMMPSKESNAEIVKTKIAKLGIEQKDIEKAIEWARKK
ncbi:MAG: hypothetical protein A2231_12620 [Candidatus Firestonebacteria bacterium RIFOXYA2_FULL_40_8]|nr:MAG: hypothetical protein A2231_12620 [Candidatus Firestonebacteria bacterium RIFOXYA2_FULL_40_8]